MWHLGREGNDRRESAQYRPRARHDGLVVREVADEVLVYDLQGHRAHALNRPALLVWRQCDGQTTVRELTERLRAALPEPGDEQVVWLALAELDRAQLLQDRLPTREAISRRQVLRRLGQTVAAGTLVLPAVTSIVAPHPAAAQSNSACTGTTCTNFATCGAPGCVCATTSEGGGFCVQGATPCGGLQACTTSATCPSGFACLVNTCCGAGGVCAPPCSAGVPAGAGPGGGPSIGQQ